MNCRGCLLKWPSVPLIGPVIDLMDTLEKARVAHLVCENYKNVHIARKESLAVIMDEELVDALMVIYLLVGDDKEAVREFFNTHRERIRAQHQQSGAVDQAPHPRRH